MKRILLLACGFVPTAFAAANQPTRNDVVFGVAFTVSLIAVAYAGNRWRLWFWGFRIGDARGSDFLLALKWSAIAAVVVVVSVSVVGLFI